MISQDMYDLIMGRNGQQQAQGGPSFAIGGTQPQQAQQPAQAQGGGPFAIGGSAPASQPNPYISQQAQALQQQSNQNLAQNVMPGIRSSALANGQYGGSRQAIAEGVAAANAQAGIAAAQAGLYSNAYNTDQANQTQRMGLQNQYNLGLGNLGLGFSQLGNQATANNQNFYTAQRGQDLQQYQLGAGLFGQGVTGQAGVGQGQYNVGQSGYQAPLTQMQQYSNLLSQYSGLGGSQVSSGNSGGGLSGALGGALAGGQIASNLGLGSSGSSGTFQQGAMGKALADTSWQNWM